MINLEELTLAQKVYNLSTFGHNNLQDDSTLTKEQAMEHYDILKEIVETIIPQLIDEELEELKAGKDPIQTGDFTHTIPRKIKEVPELVSIFKQKLKSAKTKWENEGFTTEFSERHFGGIYSDIPNIYS